MEAALGGSGLCRHQWMVYAESRMGRHLIYFKGRFNRPVEPGNLKNKWEWTETELN